MRTEDPKPNVLVTGCSTGLGLETALHLAGRGFRVYASLRDLSKSDGVLRAAADRQVTVKVLELDITRPDSILRAVDTISADGGSIFGLVNNAGIGLRGCVEDTSDTEIRQVFEANVFGTIAVTKAVLPLMRGAGKGRIVTISSVGGRISSFGVAVYCASKFALEGFSEGLALEIRPFGLRAVLIEPGIIKTERWTTHRAVAEQARSPASPYTDLFESSESLADRIVARSRTQPVDVARAVHMALTLPNPRSRYVVGRPASAAVLMRRYLPEPFFERLYFGSLLRQIQRRTHSPIAPAGSAESPSGAGPTANWT